MQLSASQFADLRQRRVSGLAAHWRTATDQRLEPSERQLPSRRLAVQAALVMRELPPSAGLAAGDVQLTTRDLDAALGAGAAWRELRAAALLNAAAALGADWFADHRLLPAADRLPVPMDAAGWGSVLSEPQGARFQAAARREAHLRPGLRAALRPLLEANEPTPSGLQPLLRAAFTPADSDAEAENEPDTEPPAAVTMHGEWPAWPPDLRDEAQAFVAVSRARLAMILGAPGQGREGAALALLGVAADLAFGLGRGARWLAAAPSGLDTAARQDWMKERLRDLAGFPA